jgi:hypothetical protein
MNSTLPSDAALLRPTERRGQEKHADTVYPAQPTWADSKLRRHSQCLVYILCEHASHETKLVLFDNCMISSSVLNDLTTKTGPKISSQWISDAGST